MVVRHLKKVREDPRYADSTIIFCPEVNMGLEGERFSKAVLNRVGNVVIYKGKTGNRNGIWTLNSIKISGVNSASKALKARSCFIDPEVASGLGCVRSDLLKKFKTHLAGLKPIQHYTPGGRNTDAVTIISGKYGEDDKIQKGKQDDLGIMYLLHHWVMGVILDGEAFGLNPKELFP